MQTNVNSFYSLLRKANEDNSILIYASSAATYGNLPSPQTVGFENPENTYGFSKYVMDQIALSFSNQNPDMTIVGLRYFNVYGPREYYKAKTASMVVQLGHQILNGNAPKLFHNSDEIYRDFIYVEDVIQANIKACSAKNNGAYNIGTGIPRSFQEIADILQIQLKTSLGTDYIENPYRGYQLNTQANINSAITELEFSPKFSLEEGIKSYLPEIINLHKTNY
jgi:ADP-L-glycero-D-manno-heptose 6-epimerase